VDDRIKKFCNDLLFYFFFEALEKKDELNLKPIYRVIFKIFFQLIFFIFDDDFLRFCELFAICSDF